MTSFALFSGFNGSQNLVGNEIGYVGRDAIINAAIGGHGDFIDVRVDGQVVWSGTAIDLGGDEITLMVGVTGIVQCISAYSQFYAAVIFDAHSSLGGGIGRLVNAGQIWGNSSGVYALGGDADDVARISNSGTMVGENDGILVDGAGRVMISNSGAIEGFRTGISCAFAANTIVQLTNSGLIRGGDAAIQLGGGADTVVNLGRLEGDVHLGGGVDLFDGRGGIVLGSVQLEAGNDRFVGNVALAEAVDGGADKDTLDFRVQGAATVALDDSFGNAGAALGDSYAGFENIMGSRSGNDQLRGDGGANTLQGNGGADELDGAGGSDFLQGGTGNDMLTGGNGNDSFAYATLTEIGDKINDFSSIAQGNNDRFVITALAFGGGLAAGPLAATQFQSRADNSPQDGDDRFIFNTSDQTLWYDDDGTGGHATVLVAHLQASATMTSLDIVLV